MANTTRTRSNRARTPEANEGYLVNLAMKGAEEQLLSGKASSQLICHFLKLGTERERLNNEKLRSELKLAEAKIKSLETAERSAKLYEKAIEAFKSYSSNPQEEGYDPDDTY